MGDHEIIHQVLLLQGRLAFFLQSQKNVNRCYSDKPLDNAPSYISRRSLRFATTFTFARVYIGATVIDH